jgi:S1-C subfamily serine protease
VLLAIDDHEVASRRELYAALWARRPGEQVVLRVYRNSEMVTVEVTPGDVEEFFA